MKTFTIKMVITCSDDFFNNQAVEVMRDIHSGKIQREFLNEYKSDGVTKVNASFKEHKK